MTKEKNQQETELIINFLRLLKSGSKTSAAIKHVEETLTGTLLVEFTEPGKVTAEDVHTLESAFNSGWNEDDKAVVIDELCNYLLRPGWNFRDLARWIRAHPGDPESVITCMKLIPPEDISIVRLQPQTGSQKLVFLGNWRTKQTEVVVKRFINSETSDRILKRELQSHILSMRHPNIIETLKFENSEKEPFLVEKRLSKVLDDKWRSEGIHEAANLLRDIGNALSFLHQNELIHGDIKPDNLGFEEGRYILLDFGICRSPTDFDKESIATGSLRTRAPELILGEGKHSYASDIWALGATVFKTYTNRFPLFNPKEPVPRISDPKTRSEFEQKLVERVRNEWDSMVDLSIIEEPLQKVLRVALSPDPAKRPTALKLLTLAESELTAFLRPSKGLSSFSPSEELQKLSLYLNKDSKSLALMPYHKKNDLQERLQNLQKAKGLEASLQTQINELLSRLKG